MKRGRISLEIPRQPIIDTNLLFDFLLWRFSLRFDRTLSNNLRYIQLTTHRSALVWYLEAAKPITTCAEVIAEIHRHAQTMRPRLDLSLFWVHSRRELAELGLKQDLVKILDMELEMLQRFGPTDAALFELCRKLHKPLLTEDTALAIVCRSFDVKPLQMLDLLVLWQEHAAP